MKRTILALILVCAFGLFSLVSCVSSPHGSESAQTPGSDPKEPTQDAPTGADYSAVFAALDAVPQDLSDYTRESARAVQDAQNAIRYGLDASEQETVNGFAEALRASLDALKPVKTFSSISEIIPYVDSLGIDFEDLAGFSLDGYFENAVLPETSDAGEAYYRDCYYLGDSITLYMHRFSNLDGSHIYGVASINPQNAAEDKLVSLSSGAPATFAEAMREMMPKRIVITIGTNSMLMDSSDYLRYFARLIEDLKAACPNAQIIIQSTPPLTHAYEANMVKLTNRNINRSNLLLAGLAAYEGVYFLNSAEALKDQSGALDPKFDLGEGYGHINRDAYDVWENYLRTHAIEN